MELEGPTIRMNLYTPMWDIFILHTLYLSKIGGDKAFIMSFEVDLACSQDPPISPSETLRGIKAYWTTSSCSHTKIIPKFLMCRALVCNPPPPLISTSPSTPNILHSIPLPQTTLRMWCN